MGCPDSVICPKCGVIREFDYGDGDGNLVTYWGGEVHDVECHECDTVFGVREYVIRWYGVVPEREPR